MAVKRMVVLVTMRCLQFLSVVVFSAATRSVRKYILFMDGIMGSGALRFATLEPAAQVVG